MDSVTDICKYHFLCFVTIMQVKVISCVTPQNLNSTHHTPRIMRSSHVSFWPRFVKGEGGDALNPSVWGWWNFSMKAVLIYAAWAEYFISQLPTTLATHPTFRGHITQRNKEGWAPSRGLPSRSITAHSIFYQSYFYLHRRFQDWWRSRLCLCEWWHNSLDYPSRTCISFYFRAGSVGESSVLHRSWKWDSTSHFNRLS